MEKTLLEYFIALVKIDSESKQEKALAYKLKSDLEMLGAKVQFDNANEHTGGEIGNLIASIPGKKGFEPLLLCAHLDTVVPGKGVKPVVEDGKIKTDETTILGADDKSGIAQIIWAIKELIDNGETIPPLEILFTVSEEIGLLGAKHCDYSLLSAKKCYTFDSHEVGSVMNGAPSQNNIRIDVHGWKAHAGVEPEKGLNAIRIASEAISGIPLGRIDDETTCNIGIISGGAATNIVPDIVEIKGEARSHSEESLERVTAQICKTFFDTAARHRVNGHEAKTDCRVEKSYSAFYVEENDPLVALAIQATQNLKLPLKVHKGGGGSDANIFNKHGIKTVVIGTGMENVHTLQEYIAVSSLEEGTLWIKELLRLYCQEAD